MSPAKVKIPPMIHRLYISNSAMDHVAEWAAVRLRLTRLKIPIKMVIRVTTLPYTDFSMFFKSASRSSTCFI